MSVSGPSDVTTYGGYFYFAGKYDSKIHRLPTSGAQAPQTYWPTTGAVNSVAVDADGAYFDQPNAVAKSSGSSQTSLGTFPIQPRFLALDASYVYVTAEDAGEVHRIPRAGGSSQKLFSAGTSTWAITVDDQWVYFSTWVASEVLRGKKDGSGATQSIAAGQAGTFDMVISGNYLYWVNQGTYAGNYADGSVLRARIDGATPGVPEPLASQQDRPQGVAVDGQAVYWVCFGNGTNTSLPPGSVWKLAL